MTGLVGRSLSLTEAFGRDGERLERDVAGEADVAEQVACVERFFAAREAHDLTRLALELGYFDLAHFTRHFRRAVGRSPTAFLRAGAAA